MNRHPNDKSPRIPRPSECIALDPIEFRLSLEVVREAEKSPAMVCPDNGGPGARLFRFANASTQRYKDHVTRWSFRFRCFAPESIWNSVGLSKRFPERNEATWAAAAELAASFPIQKRYGFKSRDFLRELGRRLKSNALA